MPHDEDSPFAPVPHSLDDAALTGAEYDRRYPLGLAHPDWRLLHQTSRWIDEIGQHWSLDVDMQGADREQLLGYLLANVRDLHARAAQDEEATTSSALAWAYWALDIAWIRDLHPLVWFESTDLARWLRAHIGDTA